MKQDMALKLQAYLDGELPAGEAQAVADLVAKDAHARELLRELTNTRAALTDHEAEFKVPASREFYWSGIRREIERQEKSAPAEAGGVSLLAWLKRLLIPATGLVAVSLAVLLTLNFFRSSSSPTSGATETSFTDAGAFTYHDYPSGTTLVWVDYPAADE